jgi:hypothetical protein
MEFVVLFVCLFVSCVITITILDNIHRPVVYLRHDVSETGLCISLQVEPT